MDQSKSRYQTSLFAAAILAIVLLCWRTLSTNNALTTERHRTEKLSAGLGIAKAERDDAIQAINRLPSALPFLEGTDIHDSSHVQIDHPLDAVFYIVSVTCQFCGENDSILHSLEAARIPLVLIALDGDVPSLKAYVAVHHLSSKAFVDVSGAFIERLPTGSVPRTVVIRTGQIRALVTGKLEPEDAKMIVDSTHTRF